MASGGGDNELEVSNKQVIFKNYVSGFPKESDMYLNANGTIKLKVPEGSNGLLVKNLHLSCDPYMCNLMKKPISSTTNSFEPGSPIFGFGVAKVVDSGNPKFKKGDLVWGKSGWEEYSLITDVQNLLKIEHTDVPLSYYTGILGMPGLTAYSGFYEVCSLRKESMSSFQQLLGQLVSLLGSLQSC